MAEFLLCPQMAEHKYLTGCKWTIERGVERVDSGFLARHTLFFHRAGLGRPNTPRPALCRNVVHFVEMCFTGCIFYISENRVVHFINPTLYVVHFGYYPSYEIELALAGTRNSYIAK